MNMKRIYREQPQTVKDKISQSMKQYHANKSENDKQKTKIKQAASMRKYWGQIPSKEENNNLF